MALKHLWLVVESRVLMSLVQKLKKQVKIWRLKQRFGDKIHYTDKLFVDKDVSLNNIVFGRYCNVAHHAELSNANIGDRTSVGRYTKVESANIGRFCSISWNVTIGATSHPLTHISTHAFSYRKLFGLVKQDDNFEKDRVKIGNDVWIGCDVIIMPGVTIGNGAVIGAGTVVTKDIDDYSVVVGNPGRHIKYRFPEESRQLLMQLKWWELPDNMISEYIDLFKDDLNNEALKELLLLK